MAYDPRPVVRAIYQRWLDAGVFQPRAEGEPYVIVIPPPNVTDILHVGHALNNAIHKFNGTSVFLATVLLLVLLDALLVRVRARESS